MDKANINPVVPVSETGLTDIPKDKVYCCCIFISGLVIWFGTVCRGTNNGETTNEKLCAGLQLSRVNWTWSVDYIIMKMLRGKSKCNATLSLTGKPHFVPAIIGRGEPVFSFVKN